MKYDFLPVITGPTASGKSALAMKLCLLTGGELVSCDSMQIYRCLDIGTAKPTADEQAQVKHHMIDIVDPGENYSVSSFLTDSRREIDLILSEGKLPVLCGGTGQYISALRDGISFEKNPKAEEITEELMDEFSKNGIDSIYKRLEKVDSYAASKIHPNNTRRVVRALAVYEATGKTLEQRNMESKTGESIYPFKIFELNFEECREELYDRVNKRVDVMMELGLEKEARYLYSLPIDRKSTCCQAIGYKEFLPFIDGVPGATIERVTYDIKLNSRHYAKRQLTWFRYMNDIKMLNRNASVQENAEIILKEIGFFE